MTRITPPTTDVLLHSALDMGEMIADGKVTSVELTEATFARIEETDGALGAYLALNKDEALQAAKAADERAKSGERLSLLDGVPVAVKDILATRGLTTTCGSKMLENWVPPYDATTVARLREGGLVIVGKTNMDEFAMGSSTEHSAYKNAHNPWDTDTNPGGSGGGSAAAVAAFSAPIALGSDTGGSIRQPAAFTGTVGAKPTYGGVSRYGAIAMASSLDQVGPCARSVADAAALQQIIGGHDIHDSTSLDHDWSDLLDAARQRDVAGMKIGVVKELSGEGYHAAVKDAFAQMVEALKDAGAEIVEVSCPNFDLALAAYYVIMPSEVSSNLARFDAMRYGMRVAPESLSLDEANAAQVMAATRAAGFGAEVKRRIILGTYALSSGYYDAYYGKAQQVRTLIQQDFARAFEQCDALISPTTPTTAFKLGERMQDPVAMYLNDIATIPANMAGTPGMSVPIGLSDEDGLPVGLQILVPAYKDAVMYHVGGAVEKLVEDRIGGHFATLMTKEA